MARIRVPVILGAGGLTVAAPTYNMVQDSWLPVVPGKSHANGVVNGVTLGDPALNGITVMVDVPDEDVTNGALDTVKVKARYPAHWLITSGVIK